MTELRSQGVEVAGEDYASNQKKELEDSAKEKLEGLLVGLIEDICFHYERIPQQKLWEWVKKIAEKEIRNV